MGFADNVAAVKGDLPTHGMNIFVDYFTKYPQHQNIFADYKGKDPASLKSMAKFKDHTTKVVTKFVAIMEKADDSGALQAECVTMGKMPQHIGLNLQQFKDVCEVAVAYLKKTLGGACDASWQTRVDAFLAAMNGKLA